MNVFFKALPTFDGEDSVYAKRRCLVSRKQISRFDRKCNQIEVDMGKKLENGYSVDDTNGVCGDSDVEIISDTGEYEVTVIVSSRNIGQLR